MNGSVTLIVGVLCIAGCSTTEPPRANAQEIPKEISQHPVEQDLYITRVVDLPAFKPAIRNPKGALLNKIVGEGYVVMVELTVKTKGYATWPDYDMSLTLESEPRGIQVLGSPTEVFSYHNNRLLDSGEQLNAELRVSSVINLKNSKDGLYRCRWKYSDRQVNNLYAGKVPLSTIGEMHSNEFFIRVLDGTVLAYAHAEDVPQPQDP